MALCDDDAWWEPRHVDRAAELLDRHPRLVVTARILVGPEAREAPICGELAASPLPVETGMPGPPLLGFLVGASVVRRLPRKCTDRRRGGDSRGRPRRPRVVDVLYPRADPLPLSVTVWQPRRPPGGPGTSVVAGILRHCGRFSDYIGSVNWDISAGDYDFWQRGVSAEECAETYIAKIGRLGQGIILMHDSSVDPGERSRNRAFQTTRLIVSVVDLEEAPQVRAELAACRRTIP